MDVAPAHALTAGHCVLSIFDAELRVRRTTGVLTDVAPAREAQVRFGLFSDWPDSTRQGPVVSVQRIAYATLRGTDLAIVVLGRTQGELRALGLEPQVIAAPRRRMPARLRERRGEVSALPTPAGKPAFPDT